MPAPATLPPLPRSCSTPIPPYRLLEESLLRSEVGVAFAREGDTALRDRLHTALVEMFADGTIEKILAEYGLDPADALGGTAGE